MNRNRTIFFTLREFSLEGFLNNEKEHQINPTSVTKTKGINKKETKSKIKGSGDKQTAKMKKADAASAAFLSPKTTASVLI